jgi:5'-methylthioadenosine phosphorylase
MRIGIIGGTGMAEVLGAVARGDAREVDTPFGRPSGPIHLTSVGGVPVALLARHGPGHLLHPTHVPYRANLFALKLLGVTHVLATGAVGSLREELPPGEPVLPDQLIDRTYRRVPTFFEELSVHVELSSPFCPHLRTMLVGAGRGLGFPVHARATYVCMEGPQLSTRAESELHRRLGGDLIGMTAMPEARLAREAELCYALIALPTDFDCWRPVPPEAERGQILEAVAKNLRHVTERGLALIREVLPRVAQAAAEPCACRSALEDALWFDRSLVGPEVRVRLAPLLGRYLPPG